MVFTIISLTITSLLLMISTLFHSLIFGVVIGLFFAFLISVLYLLLLQTLTPNLLPSAKSVGVNFSRAIRFGSVIFIAIFIAKPLELEFYNDELVKIEASLKSELQTKLSAGIIKSFATEREFLTTQLSNIYIPDEVKIKYINRLNGLKEAQEYDLERARLLVSKSGFFSQKLLKLNQQEKSVWLLTILIVILFLFPIILKIYIPKNSIYLQDKRINDRKIVEDHYEYFKKMYAELFKHNHGRLIKYKEAYSDAPYNLLAKATKTKASNQKDLLKLIYKDE